MAVIPGDPWTILDDLLSPDTCLQIRAFGYGDDRHYDVTYRDDHGASNYHRAKTLHEALHYVRIMARSNHNFKQGEPPPLSERETFINRLLSEEALAFKAVHRLRDSPELATEWQARLDLVRKSLAEMGEKTWSPHQEPSSRPREERRRRPRLQPDEAHQP